MTASAANGRCPDSPREAAAAYLAKGRVPIPLPSGRKKPAITEWEKLRPAPEDLSRLFPAGVQQNVGLLLGEPSGGLIDVDLDTAEAVAAAPFLLPPTGWMSGRAGNPKSHYWYLLDDPPRKATEKFFDLDRTDLMELRSTGGQTVVCPSLHEGTGERIVWHSFDDPADVELRPLRAAVQAVAAAAMLARHWPAKGGRHDARLALAGGLLRGGASEDFAADFITAVCVAARNDGIDDCVKAVTFTVKKLKDGDNVRGWPSLAELLGADGDRVVGQVRSWLGLRSASPGASTRTNSPARPELPTRPPTPYRPFPVEVLPEPIRSYVRQGATAIGCDVAFLALPALSVAAALIGNSRVIRLKRDWFEPCVVWSGIVGDSGTLKSPAVSVVLAPLYRLQRELLKQFKADFEQYEKDKAAYDERKRKAKKDGKDFTQDEPERPTLIRVVTGDVTIEKLAELLEDNPKGLLTCRDELGGWLNSFTRYKGKAGGSDLPNWLELSRAGTIQVDRKTGDRPTLFIQHAAVSITGGIQPGAMARALTPEFMEAGAGARLLLAMPPKRRKEWTETEIAPEVRDAYERLLRQLRDLSLDKNREGEKEPFAVRLTPEAKLVWIRFYAEWAGTQAAVDGELAAAYSKLEGYAARLTLLCHVVSRVGDMTDCEPVESTSVEAGIALARWFACETRRIYAALSETADQKLTRNLVDLLRSWGGSSTARQLQHASARYKTADDAEAALQGLVGNGLAEWSERPSGPKGGRPTRVCTLKPETDTTKTDTTSDDEDPEDDGFGDGVPTQPPDTTPPANGIPLVSGGSVGCVVVSKDNRAIREEPVSGPEAGGVVSGTPNEVVSDGPGRIEEAETGRDSPTSAPVTADTTDKTTPAVGGVAVADGYVLVTGPDGLNMVQTAVEESVVVGGDVETTGLNPRTDRARLLQLATDRGVYVIDCFAVDPSPLWDALAERPLILHNAAFDLAFLAALGFVPGVVHDTMLLSQLLHGTRRPRGFHGLQQTAARELGRTVDKAEQRSDWSGALTPEQLRYAADDAAVLPPLSAALTEKVKAVGMAGVAEIERRALPALAWMGQHGVGFDRAAWDALAREAAAEAEALARRLDAEAPPRAGRLIQDDAWNWSSPEQVKQAFTALGVPLESTDDDALAAVSHPLAGLLREYRSATKRATTYGPEWYRHALQDGRVYAAWKQIGADSGRMACASPNLQNLPRDPRYRRCFIAPPGRVLVKADYSQVELRIAAKVTGDKAMLDAYDRGEDLHTQTARLVLGVGQPTKEQRQIAKSLNFGLLYGMGAKGLRIYARSSYGVELTEEQAAEYRTAFFRAYPGLAAWHARVRRTREKESRTLAGRRRLFDAKTPDTHRLNTPVQGTGADGVKQALALLWERRAECPGAFPVLAVHDEIVVECNADRADAVTAWLTRRMVEGMAPLIAPVAVEVEATVGRTWAGK